MGFIKIDTREQDNKYIIDCFNKWGVEYVQTKLDEGDYESSDNPNFVIDLKNGILEVKNNIVGTSNTQARFYNLVLRCITKNKKLVVLVREDKIYSINGVKFWKSPRAKNKKPYTKVSGKYIQKIMEDFSEKYGVEWMFCKHDDAAKAIIAILNKNGGNIKYDYK